MVLDKRRVLFVGGIPSSMAAETIRDHFSQFDAVVSVRIMKDRHTKNSKGYAYVTVANHKSIPLILSQPQVIAGRTVDVQLASRRGEKKQWKEDQKKRKLFVSNIPSYVDNKALASFFNNFGEVRNAYVIRDFVSKASRNYGYVEFFDTSSVRQVLATEQILLDGEELSCLPFQGRLQEKKYLTPYQPRNSYQNWRFEQDNLSESVQDQQNSWNVQNLGLKTTKSYFQRVYNNVPYRREQHHPIRNRKFEFIGMSSRLNE
jgi:RNA recognition motif-containing protein